MSLSWVRAGTPVFYNCSSANERVPALILGPSQRSSDYLRIHYVVNGKAVIHDAAALHRLEFHIRSPSPSLLLPHLSLIVGAHPRNLINSMLPWMVRTPPPLDIYMLHTNHFAVYNPDSIQTARNSCETHFLAVFWVPILLCSTFL